MFAADRDLLALEPNLLRDVGWAGQRLVSGVGTVSGTTLTLVTQDVALDAAGVAAGHIVLVDGVAYEVVARLSASTATISRVRTGAAILPPTPVVNKPVAFPTFAPQLATAHRELLRALGLDEAGGVVEAAITNPDSLREVEAMGALGHIYSVAAGPNAGAGSAAAALLPRAQMWRERYIAALRTTAARIDLNGDGEPEATRRPGITQLIRD